MRLLIAVHSLAAGGAERVAVALANEWVLSGHSVIFLTIDDVASDFYILEPGVDRVALGLSGCSTGIFSAVTNNLGRLRAVRDVLLRVRPDVAIGVMSTTAILLSLASIGLNIPVIGAEHEHPPLSTIGTAWKMLRHAAYPRLDAVVALTPEGADWLRKSIGVRHVVVIPNPLQMPLPYLTPVIQPDSVVHPSQNVMLAVGSLGKIKGHDLLIRVFAMLASANPNWVLVILGEGGERNALLVLIKNFGLSERVFLPGLVGNLTDWYHRAAIFALTSRQESFSNVLVEAMAHGLPCVAFDCPAGPRHIIRDGVDGELVPDQDEDALTSVLERMMADMELRQVYGERAREVRERFAFARIMVMWDTLFDSVMAARRTGR